MKHQPATIRQMTVEEARILDYVAVLRDGLVTVVNIGSGEAQRAALSALRTYDAAVKGEYE